MNNYKSKGGAAVLGKWPFQGAALAVASTAAIIIAAAYAASGQAKPSAADPIQEARLEGTTVIMPIIMAREFPFVEGEVAGVTGKFMLDTGMQDALVINDHRVPLSGGTRVGTGFFGSGQTFDIRLHSTVDDIRIANMRIPRAKSVRSQDARMLETITPDFLGWIGYNFFRDYALKMDYKRSRATFYQEGSQQYLRGEKVVAILPFQTRKLPNHPLLTADIGGLAAVVSLDTGMNGSLIISNADRALLLSKGYLKRTSKPDAFDLNSVRLAKAIDIELHSLEIEEGPSPAAKSMGITESTELQLGYVFLKQYKTVWDFQQKKVYLLAR